MFAFLWQSCAFHKVSEGGLPGEREFCRTQGVLNALAYQKDPKDGVVYLDVILLFISIFFFFKWLIKNKLNEMLNEFCCL